MSTGRGLDLRGKTDIAHTATEFQCPLLAQSGHPRLKFPAVQLDPESRFAGRKTSNRVDEMA